MKYYTVKLTTLQHLESNFGLMSGEPFEVLSEVLKGKASINFTDDDGKILENSKEIQEVLINFHVARAAFDKIFPKH